MMSSQRPSDQAARDFFAQQLGTSCSVIAPAGVGKTTAIVARAVHYLREAEHAPARYGPLIVVTYTRSAAAELEGRTRRELAASGATVRTPVFFGTIHAFAYQLLLNAPHTFNLPSKLVVGPADERLWQRFLREHPRPFDGLDDAHIAHLQRRIHWEWVYRLARYGFPETRASNADSGHLWHAPPEIHLQPVLDFSPKGAERTRNKVRADQRALGLWYDRLHAADGSLEFQGLGVPSPSTSAQAFVALWEAALAPYRAWLRERVEALSTQCAARYAQYRREQGALEFDDLIQLLHEHIRDSSWLRAFRRSRSAVILDEAQDTDAAQFKGLIELCRSEAATEVWQPGEALQLRPGAFCMVGDPQQTLYGERVDPELYMRLHTAIDQASTGCALTFDTTFRCQRDLVEPLNAVFPSVLHASDSDQAWQAEYVPLKAFGAAPSRCVRLDVPAGGPPQAAELARAHYAKDLAQRLQALGPPRGSAALLMLRNAWVKLLAEALRACGLEVSETARAAHPLAHPAHAWCRGLIHALAHPDDAFEVAGVLRECFGIDDRSLAEWVEAYASLGREHPLSLRTPPPATHGPIGTALLQLHNLAGQASARDPLALWQEVVDSMGLQERLEALALTDVQPIAAVLDHYLLQAAQVAQQGGDLIALARAVQHPEAVIERAADAPEGCWQVMTVHQSKGMTFDQVCLPFLFCEAGQSSEFYPRYVPTGVSQRVLALDPSGVTPAAKAYQNSFEQRQRERLAYVAMTRARQQVILVNDLSWWKSSKRSLGDALRLGKGRANTDWFKSLTPVDTADEKPLEAYAPARSLEDEPAAPPERPVPVAAESILPLLHARALATDFPEAQTASAQASHRVDDAEGPASEKAIAAAGSAAAYGNWWHEALAAAPWNEGTAEGWARWRASALAQCPQRERGARELDLFLEHMDLQALREREWCVHVEMPLLWHAPEGVIYEGVVDLAARDATRGHWWILDWKTDRCEAGQVGTYLLERYAAQLKVYARAIEALDTRATVTRVDLYAVRYAELVAVPVP